MPNQFINVKTIARQILPHLIDNLVMPNLTYNDYSDTYSNLGDTIQVRKPVVYTAQDFTVGTPVVAQDVVEDSVDVKLDKIATVDIKLNAFEAALNMGDSKVEQNFIVPAAIALAEKINKSGLEQYKFAGNIAGTAGTTPDGLDDFAAIRRIFNENKAPLSDRRAIWDVAADEKFTLIGNLIKVNEAGSPRGLREGEIGRVFGLDNYMSQAVASHTAGSLTAGGTAASGAKVKSAVTNGTSIVLISNASASGTLTGSLKAGDVLTIGSDSVVGLVAEDCTAASNEITVKLKAPITVSANDSVSIGSAYVGNLAFHKNAIAFVTRPLHAPSGVEAYTTSYNGISLRVVKGYDIDNKTEKMSVDVLYAYKTVYPELSICYRG